MKNLWIFRTYTHIRMFVHSCIILGTIQSIYIYYLCVFVCVKCWVNNAKVTQGEKCFSHANIKFKLHIFISLIFKYEHKYVCHSQITQHCYSHTHTHILTLHLCLNRIRWEQLFKKNSPWPLYYFRFKFQFPFQLAHYS